MGVSGKCARNLINWVSSLANARLRVDNKDAFYHLVDSSIKTIKYLNGEHGGCMGPQISPCIRSRKLIDSKLILAGDGRIINLPSEEFAGDGAAHEKLL